MYQYYVLIMYILIWTLGYYEWRLICRSCGSLSFITRQKETIAYRWQVHCSHAKRRLKYANNYVCMYLCVHIHTYSCIYFQVWTLCIHTYMHKCEYSVHQLQWRLQMFFCLELTTPLIVSASSAISHTHTNVCVVAFKYMYVCVHIYSFDCVCVRACRTAKAPRNRSTDMTATKFFSK